MSANRFYGLCVNRHVPAQRARERAPRGREAQAPGAADVGSAARETLCAVERRRAFARDDAHELSLGGAAPTAHAAPVRR
jgi:hypothetical protein